MSITLFPINLCCIARNRGIPRLIDDFLGLKGSHQLIGFTLGHAIASKQRLIGKKGWIDISHLPMSLVHQMPRRPNSLHEPALSGKGYPQPKQSETKLSWSYVSFLPISHTVDQQKFREDLTIILMAPKVFSSWQLKGFLKSTRGHGYRTQPGAPTLLRQKYSLTGAETRGTTKSS